MFGRPATLTSLLAKCCDTFSLLSIGGAVRSAVTPTSQQRKCSHNDGRCKVDLLLDNWINCGREAQLSVGL